MPKHLEGTEFQFDDLPLGGYTATADGTAYIEIDCSGNWYVDRIEMNLYFDQGSRILNEQLSFSSDAMLADLIRRGLLRHCSTAITQACERAAERGTISNLVEAEG